MAGLCMVGFCYVRQGFPPRMGLVSYLCSTPQYVRRMDAEIISRALRRSEGRRFERKEENIMMSNAHFTRLTDHCQCRERRRYTREKNKKALDNMYSFERGPSRRDKSRSVALM